MHITGQCHCGNVTYEAEIDPERVAVCHCTDCQRFSGSAFRASVGVPDADLKIAGNPKIYRKVAESGRVRLQYFCPECGSALFTTGEGEGAANWNIRWGSIDQRADLTPRRQIWYRSAAAWVADVPGLPGVQTDR